MSKARGTANRQDFPRDPAAVLRQLRAWREGAGKIQAEVTIQGPIYRACEGIGSKIDELARWLTGEEGYFSRNYSGSYMSPEGLARWRRWDAIERGDEPWPDDGMPR